MFLVFVRRACRLDGISRPLHRDRVSDGSALWDAMGAADSPVIEIVFNTDPYIDSHRPFGSTSVYINVEVPRDGAVMNMPGDYIYIFSTFPHLPSTPPHDLASRSYIGIS